ELREVGSGSDARGTSLDAISLRAVESLSSSDTETIAIAAVNDAPSLTAPTNAKIGYSEQAAGGTALMQGVVLSDVDLPANFAGGSISLTVSGSEGGINLRSGSAFVINSNGADGTFSLARQEGPTQVGIGLISGIGTTNVQITDLIAPANLVRLNDLLDEFVYLNNSDAPTPGDRTVTLTFNDGGNTGGGGLTDAETQTLTVTAVNDAPVNNVPAAQTGTEDVALVFSAANSNAITISDADIGAGVASVLLTVANGTLTLGDTTDLAQPPVGDGTGTVALVGTVTAINKALEGLSYLGALNSNGARTLTIATSDNGFTGPNLIVNPGAETGVRAGDYSSSVVPSGWTRVDAGGSFTALNYDVPGQASSDLDENDSAAVGGGNGYFAGGPSTPGSTAIRQIIDVSGSAAAIDAGTMLANLSGLFGGYLGVNDRMTMTARFLDGMGVQLATASIGDVTAAERGSQTLLVPEFAIAGVPVGTRSIEVVLTAVDSGDGNYGNGYADNVSLVLSQLVSNTVSIDLTPVDDAPVARNDADTTDENTVATGNVFDDNGSGADSDVDGPPLSVSEVNGEAVAVGQPFTLVSGATLTLNSDGSYSYDPIGKFVTLTDNSSGAVNTSKTDSFNYTLTNGNTATVTITINGVAGPGDRLEGDGTDNTITGTPQSDFFLLQQGGDDKAYGLAGNDNFYIGGAMTSADVIDGGSGSDTLALQGNYAALTLGAGVVGLELIALMPGDDTRFGGNGKSYYDYNITSVDENVAAGTQLQIDAGRLREGEDFTFDGSAETDGSFRIAGGYGDEDLTGGA
ncbi:MAG TPA: Ig-like domain-containing protein, partial [Thermoanaerobaculia bacterium]